MLPISILVACGHLAMVQTMTTSVDPSIQYQSWEGFGTSLAWWAHIVGDYAEPLRTTLVDKAIGDLGLNVLRYNIGGGEAPGLNYMEIRARVPGYLNVNGTYDWTADAAQRWVLNRGIQLGANKFEAFSNSPPYYMTISGSVTGGAGGADNLQPTKFNDFATYLATVTKHFRDSWGVKFDTIDPMNEPGSPWWTLGNRQEGCRFSPGQNQSNVIAAMASALNTAGLATKISACDESYNTWAVSSWDALTTEAKSHVYQLNTHCYSGSSQHWVNHRAVRDNKRLWMSEYGDGDASGLTTAHQIVTDLRVMMPTAWVYWQIIDGGYGWGCIDIDLNSKSQTYTVNPKYYAFAQFSKFIRPGAQFISIGDNNSVCVLNGTQLVIVTVSDSDQTITYDLSKFSKLGKTVSVTQTSPTQNLVKQRDLSVVKRSFFASVPAKSVTTFVIEGCTFAGTTLTGFHTLASKATGKLLDVPGSSWTEGQELTTNITSGAFSQQWRFELAQKGWLKLCNRESGLYMALWDSSANNFPVLQWEDNGDSTLPWSITPNADGTYGLFANRYPTKALTENPTRGNGWPDVALYDSYGGKEQEWSIGYVAPLYPQPPRKKARQL